MTTPKVRYTIVEAARRAQMGTELLGRLIRAGDVPGASYVKPEPGSRNGRWIIPARPFDDWLGLATENESDPETPAPTRTFLKKLA